MNDNIKTIPFEIDHLCLFDVDKRKPCDMQTYRNVLAQMSVALNKGLALTFTYNEQVLGCSGFFELWPGVCEVWFLPGPGLSAHRSILARKIKRHVALLQEIHKFHRIQATALDDKENNDWFTFMGFKCEGILKKYTQTKQNYKIWARG